MVDFVGFFKGVSKAQFFSPFWTESCRQICRLPWKQPTNLSALSENQGDQNTQPKMAELIF
jgi:hypothetical protein